MNKDTMPLSCSEITSVLDCDILCSGPGRKITGVSIDSREVVEGSIFFALHGERNDGHRFVPDVSSRASCCIIDTVDSRIEAAVLENSCMLVRVHDTLSSTSETCRILQVKIQ